MTIFNLGRAGRVVITVVDGRLQLVANGDRGQTFAVANEVTIEDGTLRWILDGRDSVGRLEVEDDGEGPPVGG